MGHYASEMYPPVRHEPEVLIQRRADARRHAEYVWNDLYPKYEKQGVWIRDDVELVCPLCFAKVPALLRADHDRASHPAEAARRR